jgi:hypothetical protein
MINTRGSAAERALADQLGVTGTPTLLIYPRRGSRARKMLIYYYVGNTVRRKPMAQVIAEIRRQAFGR